MRFRQTLVYLLVTTQLLPARFVLAAGIPAGREKSRMGILRVGEPATPGAERAYPLVEKRMQRWLENFEGISAAVEPFAGSVKTEEISLETDRARLAALSASRPGETGALIEKVGKTPRFSPDVQRALTARAAERFRAGERKEAEALLKRAAALHPDAAIVTWNGWDEPGEGSSAGSAAAFDVLVSEAGRSITRSCALVLDVTPASAEVKVNGFDLKNRRTFQLSGEHPYAMEVTAPGHRPVETIAQCGRALKKEVRVALLAEKPGASANQALLTEISRRRGVQTLCLIEPRGDEFKLYLYTPSRAIEEIPLKSPLRVAEVLGNPSESSMPIASDAFMLLWEKHRTSASELDREPDLRLASAASTGFAGAPGETSAEVPRGSGEKWYNNSTFWWITGGLAGGVVLTYLLTRGGTTVKSQPTGISIKID